jgi:ferritin-like metal-binding protein YciE
MASLDEQLDAYLSDAHAIEEQALPQMRAAPDLAGDPELAAAFRGHLAETERHERLVRERLAERGGSPSRLKEAVFKAGGFAFVLFAKSQPDTTGKLVSHALSYEHLELAAYDLLRRVAERAGDAETADAAGSIAADERAMAERLEAALDRAVDASLRELDPDDLDEQLNKYLADAHAIEAQAIALLQRGQKLAGDAELARVYEHHLEETREHERLVAERLEARGGSPSKLKDAAMRLGGLNWSVFFGAQPDTPAKLAAFVHAFEFLEVGGYEQLRRVARRAGDAETERLAERIVAEERAAAERVAGTWDAAVDVALSDLGVTGSST